MRARALATLLLIPCCGLCLAARLSVAPGISSAPIIARRARPLCAAEAGASFALRREREALGKALFFDRSLSSPPGMSCASCHDPAAGYTYPNSRVNSLTGVVPGVLAARYGNRRPPTIAYVALRPVGPPHYIKSVDAYVGGLFLDGRARDLVDQVGGPLQNPNEMNNVLHGAPAPELVVGSVKRGPYAGLFRRVFGSDIFDKPAAAFACVAEAIAAYERTREVSPFTSKYDDWRRGKARLTRAELDGLRLFTGTWSGRPGGRPYRKNARCAECHAVQSHPAAGPDLFTDGSFANAGVPRNYRSPYYRQTDRTGNPLGFNAAGEHYVDFGLGAYLYPRMGLQPGNCAPGSGRRGDFLHINGAFVTPTLRNVAKIPYPGFVRAYMHNGVFKSLKEVVHFYNTRNLTTARGEVIDLRKPHPYAHLRGRPLWAPPECLSLTAIENPAGLPASKEAQVGNLRLTNREENHIVAFLKTLTDR